MTENVDELPWKPDRKWVRRFFWTKTCTSPHSGLVRHALRRSSFCTYSCHACVLGCYVWVGRSLVTTYLQSPRVTESLTECVSCVGGLVLHHRSQTTSMASHLNVDLIAVQLNDSTARALRAVSCGEAGSHQARIPAQIAFVPNKEHVDSLGCIFTALSCDQALRPPSADQ